MAQIKIVNYKDLTKSLILNPRLYMGKEFTVTIENINTEKLPDIKVYCLNEQELLGGIETAIYRLISSNYIQVKVKSELTKENIAELVEKYGFDISNHIQFVFDETEEDGNQKIFGKYESVDEVISDFKSDKLKVNDVVDLEGKEVTVKQIILDLLRPSGFYSGRRSGFVKNKRKGSKIVQICGEGE